MVQQYKQGAIEVIAAREAMGEGGKPQRVFVDTVAEVAFVQMVEMVEMVAIVAIVALVAIVEMVAIVAQIAIGEMVAKAAIVASGEGRSLRIIEALVEEQNPSKVKVGKLDLNMADYPY